MDGRMVDENHGRFPSFRFESPPSPRGLVNVLAVLHFSPFVSCSVLYQNCHQSPDTCNWLAPSCPGFTALTVE